MICSSSRRRLARSFEIVTISSLVVHCCHTRVGHASVAKKLSLSLPCPRVPRGPASRRRRERDRGPCLAKSIRHHTGAAGSDASDSIRACCLSSAQNSEGILPCSEL